MVQPDKSLTKRAQKHWELRELSALESMQRDPQAAKVPEVLYFVGLALNALNKRERPSSVGELQRISIPRTKMLSAPWPTN
jgi:ABC-type glutathione transport system ATPase component